MLTCHGLVVFHIKYNFPDSAAFIFHVLVDTVICTKKKSREWHSLNDLLFTENDIIMLTQTYREWHSYADLDLQRVAFLC